MKKLSINSIFASLEKDNAQKGNLNQSLLENFLKLILEFSQITQIMFSSMACLNMDGKETTNLI